MRGPAILAAAALLAAPAAGRAEPRSSMVPAKARVLADRGRAFHDAGDYAQAIAAFTQAYAMAPSPALLFNLAQAYRLQGNCDTAALMYRRYLATNANPEGRGLAETHLANVERCLRTLALHIPVPAATGSLVAPAGLDGPAIAAAAAPRTAQIEKAVGIGLVLCGGVTLGAAAYYGVQAHDAEGDVTAGYASGATWRDLAPVDARGKAAATTARILGVSGALGVAGGVAMYMIGKHTGRTSVTAAPRGRGVEVSMLWTF